MKVSIGQVSKWEESFKLTFSVLEMVVDSA